MGHADRCTCTHQQHDDIEKSAHHTGVACSLMFHLNPWQHGTQGVFFFFNGENAVFWGESIPVVNFKCGNHPAKVTWQWKANHLKRYALSKMVMFYCEVLVLGGNSKSHGDKKSSFGSQYLFWLNHEIKCIRLLGICEKQHKHIASKTYKVHLQEISKN